MNKPELLDGYTKIANELLDAIIKFKLSGQELRTVLFVIRKTYGFNKKEDRIALSQFMDNLNITKPRASLIVSNLTEMNILKVIEKDNSYIKKYLFNKYYRQWKRLLKKVTVIENNNGVIENNNKGYHLRESGVIENNNHKRKNYTKERTKEIKKIYKRKIFVKPSFEEVAEYCDSRNNEVNPAAFLDCYETNGWKVGKNKMVNWQAAVRTWEYRQKQENSKYL